MSETVMPEVFKKATRREIMLARTAYQADYLLNSVYLNLGKQTIPIHHEYMRRLRWELDDPDDGVLLNYVGPMSKEELAAAMQAREKTGYEPAQED